MNKVKIITDGSCDLPEEYVKKNDVEVVPFYITFDKKTYYKEGGELSTFDILTKMDTEEDAYPSTSLPSPEDYYNAFLPYVEQGMDIVCFCITSKFSGSFNSANTAKDLIVDQFPNANIYVLDTQINTVLQGLMVKETIKMRDSDFSALEIFEKCSTLSPSSRILFTLDTLKFLKHGGRIGKAASLIGTILKINPIIMLRDGEIFSCGKALSRPRAIIKIKELLLDHFKDLNVSDYKFIVGYGLNTDEALKFRSQIASWLNISEDSIEVEPIGAIICAHTGPRSLGLAFLKRYDV